MCARVCMHVHMSLYVCVCYALGTARALPQPSVSPHHLALTPGGMQCRATSLACRASHVRVCVRACVCVCNTCMPCVCVCVCVLRMNAWCGTHRMAPRPAKVWSGGDKGRACALGPADYTPPHQGRGGPGGRNATLKYRACSSMGNLGHCHFILLLNSTMTDEAQSLWSK